jgi:hypothetical protein
MNPRNQKQNNGKANQEGTEEKGERKRVSPTKKKNGGPTNGWPKTSKGCPVCFWAKPVFREKKKLEESIHEECLLHPVTTTTKSP